MGVALPGCAATLAAAGALVPPRSRCCSQFHHPPPTPHSPAGCRWKSSRSWACGWCQHWCGLTCTPFRQTPCWRWLACQARHPRCGPHCTSTQDQPLRSQPSLNMLQPIAVCSASHTVVHQPNTPLQKEFDLYWHERFTLCVPDELMDHLFPFLATLRGRIAAVRSSACMGVCLRGCWHLSSYHLSCPTIS